MTLPHFHEWFKDLCSDVRWYENTLMTEGKGKDFKKAAQHIYNLLLADVRIRDRDMIENRKHVYNKLGTMKPEQVFPVLQQLEEKKVDPEWIPLTGEAREKRRLEFLAAHLACVDTKRVAPISARERMGAENLRPMPDSIKEPTHEEKVKAAENHYKIATAARVKYFREKYPNGTTKELQAYLKQFKAIDNPFNL